MTYQSLFREKYVEDLRRRVENGEIVDYYKSDSFEYDKEQVLFTRLIAAPASLELLSPEDGNFNDAENAKLIFQAYKELTPLQASNVNFWAYLAHVDLYPYMCKRWSRVKDGTAKNPSQYILDHWFISSPTQSNLLRHGLAGLWWAAYLSFDPSREDPFELTDILYTQLDLATRTLGTYKLARHKPAVIGVLEFIKENDELFREKFEAKQRFVTKYLNQVGGVKPLAFFEKEFFKETLVGAKSRVAAV